MPETKTTAQAKKAKSPSTQAGEYVREEIEHVREGKHGARSAKQAIAQAVNVVPMGDLAGRLGVRGDGLRDLRRHPTGGLDPTPPTGGRRSGKGFGRVEYGRFSRFPLGGKPAGVPPLCPNSGENAVSAGVEYARKVFTFEVFLRRIQQRGSAIHHFTDREIGS